ncbi:MAG: hypothetical protein H0W02_04965 [Ktedonobacteraceae bacterium]|nr:hypothetical protein [Ktedonobacteraceae bacterium]
MRSNRNETRKRFPCPTFSIVPRMIGVFVALQGQKPEAVPFTISSASNCC